LLGIGAPNTGGVDKYFLIFSKALQHASTYSKDARFSMRWLKG